MDVRTEQSKAAILGAFRQLVFTVGYDAIKVNELIATAGVARSTFYKHFADKRAVLITSMEHLLVVLSRCASGSATCSDIRALVEHLWENQQLGRAVFSSNAFEPIVRALAELVHEETKQSKIECFAFAYRQLGTIKAWLSGEFHAQQADLVEQLMHCDRNAAT